MLPVTCERRISGRPNSPVLPHLKGILSYADEPQASRDFDHDSHSLSDTAIAFAKTI